MLRFLLIVIFLNISLAKTFSQTYSGKKSGMFFFVDVNEKAAHVEVFSTEHTPYSGKKRNDEFLIPVIAGDTVFTGKENQLLKKGNKYRLVHAPSPDGKIYGIKLKSCVNDTRPILRSTVNNLNVKFRDEKPDASMPDSNIASQTISVISEETFKPETNISSSDTFYLMKAGRSGDSLVTLRTQRDTLSYFAPASVNIYALVSHHKPVSNVNDLLNETSTQRREYLIGYKEQNPFVKSAILNARVPINDHKYLQNVEVVKSSGIAQLENLVPKHKSSVSSSLMVLLVTLVIVTEIALISSLAYWIFRSNSLSY